MAYDCARSHCVSEQARCVSVAVHTAHLCHANRPNCADLIPAAQLSCPDLLISCVWCAPSRVCRSRPGCDHHFSAMRCICLMYLYDFWDADSESDIGNLAYSSFGKKRSKTGNIQFSIVFFFAKKGSNIVQFIF